MTSDTMDTRADFFLNEIPNVKISRDKPDLPKAPLKTEMLNLRLNDTTEKLLLETLRQIHGPDYMLTDISTYKDQRSNLGHKYWMDRGNLVIKGGSDNAQMNNSETAESKYRNFAILRLESYGFHTSHCNEALDYCNGEVDLALQLLFQKYYNLQRNSTVTYDERELLEQREDEKNVLESIYESAFEEKIANSVWILTFNLNYLVRHKKPVENKIKVVHNNNKKPLCRNVAKGIECRFGNKCRFSHEIKAENDKNKENNHLNPSWFELEIRFPKDSLYPYEPPLIFLKTSTILPDQQLLHICRRLLQCALELSEQGMVSVYSIAELLTNEEEIVRFLKTNREKFLSEYELLFSKVPEMKNKKLLPSHYQKGLTYKDSKPKWSEKDMIKEDLNLVDEFKTKKNNPKYIRSVTSRTKLPAWGKMAEILSTLSETQVVVISGETGCGKSTQVPQFILDDWLLNYNNKHLEIICTQPRRISAIGVAERVASERVEKCGKSTGYQIRLESKTSVSTRLTFCTTGILLRRLESEPYLSSVTHIIVDEVHERSEESDFLLLILKQLLPRRPDLKIILMSATLNAEIFCDYFQKVPIIEIPGRTFPVEEFYLEDILETTGYILEENSQYTRNIKKIGDRFEEELAVSDVQSMKPRDNIRDENLTIGQIFGRYEDYRHSTCKNLYLMDCEKTNLELIENILLWIVQGDHAYPKEGSILVFLPGIAEITALHEQLNNTSEFNSRSNKYVLLPLHSTLTSEEQAAIFKKPKDGARKIVLSTNIAETSVTIDDCVFVIDCGKMKEKRYDPNRNMESLELVWVSRANAKQRKGRAGRVMKGVCFHLFTKHRYKHHFIEQPIPELHRVPLEQLVLRIKVLPNFSDQDVHLVLGNTIEPPSKEGIDSAIHRLQDVGALDEVQELTPLGLHLAALPVDVRIGKLMLFGAIFCCVDSALTIAACLSYKSPFVSPFGKKDISNAKRKNFATANSDQLTILKAYNKWKEASMKSRLAGNVFAVENYLSSKTLDTLSEIKYQLLELLVSIGFVPIDLNRKKSVLDRISEITGPQLNANGDNPRLLSAILCAALYPNVVKVLTPEKSFTVSSAGAVPRQPKPEELRFKTKQDGFVHLHPSSINSTVGHFPSPYLVFQEKIKTSRVFIRDCSMVPSIPLILFSGCNLHIEVHNGNTILVLEDGWIMFRVEKHEVAEMVKAIRLELFELLEEKIRDPLLNLLHHENGKKIISSIVHVVTND